MVVPCRARSLTTSSTSPTSSGSSADVGSPNRSGPGSRASARATATLPQCLKGLGHPQLLTAGQVPG